MKLKEVFLGATYRNKKTGNLYYVLMKGMNTEPNPVTGEQEDVVIYARADDVDKRNQVWVRPLELFKEKFEEIVVK